MVMPMDYQIVLLIHILAGAAWVGGAIVIEGTIFAARRLGSPEAVDRVLQSFRWADTWLAIGAPVLVIVTGVAMVMLGRGWTFEQAWILGSIGLVVAYEVIAMTVGGRIYSRIEVARAEGALASQQHEVTIRQLGRLGVVLLAILIAVTGLMVFKPM